MFGKYNGFVSKARVSACMYFLVILENKLMVIHLGPVAQRWVSANPGLKFDLLFWFVSFCTYIYFTTSEK
jgi:hypothetical protein